MDTGQLDIGGVPVRFLRRGSGPDVLLLHGWGGSSESLYPLIQALEPSFRATAIDFPGHGRSGLPPRPWTVSDFVDCTLEAMDRLELARPAIVAHSFGGRVTIKVAASRPERAGPIVFTAGAGVPPPAGLVRTIKRAAVRLAPLVPARLRARLLPWVASPDYLAAGPLRPTFRNIISEDLTPLLASIRSRCLLIWGDRDQETPLHCGRVMARLIPQAELIVFPGAGHFPYLDQPHKFNLHLLKFLREETA